MDEITVLSTTNRRTSFAGSAVAGWRCGRFSAPGKTRGASARRGGPPDAARAFDASWAASCAGSSCRRQTRAHLDPVRAGVTVTTASGIRHAHGQIRPRRYAGHGAARNCAPCSASAPGPRTPGARCADASCGARPSVSWGTAVSAGRWGRGARWAYASSPVASGQTEGWGLRRARASEGLPIAWYTPDDLHTFWRRVALSSSQRRWCRRPAG